MNSGSVLYRQQSVALHFTWKPLQAKVEAVLPELDELLRPFGARPHWGKLFTPSGPDWEALYPRFADFRLLAARHDPEGKFPERIAGPPPGCACSKPALKAVHDHRYAGLMNRRLAALSAVPLLLLLSSCGAVEEAAGNAASDAASKVASAAAEEVNRQICAVIQDGMVSMEEKQVLGGLVSAARTAGVPTEITTPLGEIAEAGDQVPSESVQALKDACQA